MLSSISARFSVRGLGWALAFLLGVVPGSARTEMPGTLAIERFEVGPNVYVRALALDQARGSIWVGTSVGALEIGLDTLEARQVFTRKEGLANEYVFAIGVAPGGEVWVGTYGGGLSVFDAETETWQNYNIPNGMGDAFVYDALEAENGDLCIATWSGVNRIRGGAMDDISKWNLYTVENTGGGLPSNHVFALHTDEAGRLWIGTKPGPGDPRRRHVHALWPRERPQRPEHFRHRDQR